MLIIKILIHSFQLFYTLFEPTLHTTSQHDNFFSTVMLSDSGVGVLPQQRQHVHDSMRLSRLAASRGLKAHLIWRKHMRARMASMPQKIGWLSCRLPPNVSCTIPDKPFVQITVNDAARDETM